jgi:hypothetical protein
MKIQLLSDLHLETHPHLRSPPAPQADVLVLAGDIGSYQRGSALLDQADPDFGLGRFSPLRGWPVPVLFVPGNHEYDGLDFDSAHARLRETCERLGLVWLEREAWFFRGVRFLGTTLWADFDALATDLPMGQALLAREKACRAANHYLRKTGTQREGRPWLAQEVRSQALACQDWLGRALAQPHAGPTVVVTHFAPSLHSADPRYGLTPGTAGFCNRLDHLVEQADLWLHGHLHCAQDYRIGRCRVRANPLGYATKDEQAHFDPVCVVPLTAPEHNP